MAPSSKNKYWNQLIRTSFVIVCMGLLAGCMQNKNLAPIPSEFTYLSFADPTIIHSPRYSGSQNFLGRKVPGYDADEIVCTKKAALALKLAHDTFKGLGYRLVVYDGYRPQRAVDAFMAWSKDVTDQSAKSLYYPTIDKRDVFKLGYVAEKSGHSRGSTFDLTLIPIDQDIHDLRVTKRHLKNGEEIPFLDDGTLDMGSSFDLFHEVSHHGTNLISKEQTRRRELLRRVMKESGFKDYHEEWWHYTLENEPFTMIYFDFLVSKAS